MLVCFVKVLWTFNVGPDSISMFEEFTILNHTKIVNAGVLCEGFVDFQCRGLDLISMFEELTIPNHTKPANAGVFCDGFCGLSM